MVGTDDILEKYGAKIESKMNNFNARQESGGDYTETYKAFKKSMSPEFSKYEKWCKSLGSSVKVKVKDKDAVSIQKDIDFAHMNVTPAEVMGLAAMAMMLTIIGGILFLTATYLITKYFSPSESKFSIMMMLLIFGFSAFVFFFMSKTPERLAMKWKLKASSQMVPALLYIVIYMKHTSNLEKAIAFAAENLDDPLAGDFKKIFWEVESKKYSTIKDALDIYLESWKGFSIEFVEAFHLIESSLYEPNEGRRIQILERGLSVILEGVYDKMLKYSHEVKSPLTNVYMLGIVLPTLALAILPLASTMVGDAIKASHLFLLFNIIIPFFVVYLTYGVMMKRPGGHGDSMLLKQHPLYPKYISKKPLRQGLMIGIPIIIIGLLPLIWMYSIPLHPNYVDWTFGELGINFMQSSSLLGIQEHVDFPGKLVGPFGPVSLILSLCVPLGIALIFIIAYKKRTEEIIKEKNKYTEVENEFTSSLFQLGNRIGDGFPAEVAFSKVAASTKGTATEGFFKVVSENIINFGMNLDRALFDKEKGAVVFYPSHLIVMSMKILSESVKKGLQVAAKSLMSISEYVKNIKKVETRLNDLLAEIISDMKSNMTFLAPMLSGIIVALSGMITMILGSLGTLVGSMESGSGGLAGGMDLGSLMSMFELSYMIPTYWLQIIVGIYLIEVVFILTATLVTINSGKDDLTQTAEIGKNLKKSMMMYLVVSIIAIFALTLIGGVALAGIAG